MDKGGTGSVTCRDRRTSTRRFLASGFFPGDDEPDRFAALALHTLREPEGLRFAALADDMGVA